MILDLYNPSDVEIFATGTEGKIVGITSRCYDLVHDLHLVYFLRCRRLCDVLVVGVDSDDLVRQCKGPKRPIVPENKRVNMVNAMNPVQAAFVMGSVEDFRTAVQSLGAKKIFKNQDFDPKDVAGNELAEVVIVPDIAGVDSTSEIIEQIIKRG